MRRDNEFRPPLGAITSGEDHHWIYAWRHSLFSIEERSEATWFMSCQQSASAVMTLFDRFRGWENAALKAFSKALSDRSLFVFGYSGFDFDVLLSIRDSTVKKIYWLCQPGIGFSFPELPDVIGRERMFRLEGDIHDFFARAAKHFGTPQFVRNCTARSLESLRKLD
jgi:hypothetical protein